MYKRITQQGFSLIELLVTLVISGILLLGTVSVLVNNFSMSRANDRFARMNENAMLSINFLTQDLSMAFFDGCGDNINNNIATAVSNGDLLDLTSPDGAIEKFNSIDGLDDSNKLWNRFGTNQLAAQIVDGTDAITVRKVRGEGALVTADMSNKNEAIKADLSDYNHKANDILVVYNCKRLDVFQSTSTGPDIAHGGLTTVYTSANRDDAIRRSAARIAAFDSVRYFVGQDANGQSGLWREVLINMAPVQQELIKGVEDMQVLYGFSGSVGTVSNDRKASLVYRRADQITGTQWNNVRSIKVALLISSNYVSTGGDDSLQNEDEDEDYAAYKAAQVAAGEKHILLDKEVPWQSDSVVRQVINKEIFFRNNQF